MHAYRRFVEDQMDERHWTRADLARHSGLSKQTISNIVNDKRESLGSPPDGKTVDGLAQAFSMSRDKVLAFVALAMGLPVSIERADVRAVSDAELLSEIRRRMEARHDRQGDTQQGPEARSTEHRSEDRREDGGTAGGRQAPMTPSFFDEDVQRGSANGGDELKARRDTNREDEIDSVNFGTRHKPGSLEDLQRRQDEADQRDLSDLTGYAADEGPSMDGDK